MARDAFVKIRNERDGALVVQANWRAYCSLKNWPWQQLLFKIRPLLNTTEKAKEMEELLEEYEAMCKELEAETKIRKKLEQEHVQLIQMKNKLSNDFAGENDAIQDAEDRLESLQKSKIDLDGKIKELQERLEDEEEINLDLNVKKRKLETECKELRKDIDDLESTLAKVKFQNFTEILKKNFKKKNSKKFHKILTVNFRSKKKKLQLNLVFVLRLTILLTWKNNLPSS